MLTLRTLGTADLRDTRGREVRAVLQQPKRLALLVYLTVAKPDRMQRRDSLLGLFWPNLDQDHARAALRRALYFLRQACGTEAFATRGDDELGIVSSALWCDALAFDEAAAAGEAATAMELYQGDFLDGFYVQGGPDAEAWIDRERTRRREDAAALAWQLAEKALTGDVADAQRWARRGLELAPFGEDAVARFVDKADQAGERGVALRILDGCLQRLETELESEPGEELSAVAARLRGADRATSGVTRQGGTLVAVCPFVVRGDPGVSYLREGMVDLLSTKLDGTRNLRTVDPPTVIRLAASRAPQGVDLTVGQQLAGELGADAFVVGTVIESGGRLEAGIGLYDAAGKLRARAEARTDIEADLFELVDELVRRLVIELSDAPPDRLVRLAALTTTSLPALRAYLVGEHEFRLGRHLQALDAFRRATDLDPSFALAYYRLASSLAASALAGPAREASVAAHRHRERLSDHDRPLIEAQHAWLRGHTAEAERRYAALTVSFPEHLEPWFLLGDLLFHANPYRGRSIAEARDPLERALAIDGKHLSAITQLARLAALDHRYEDLQELVERALRLSPSADQALGLRTLLAFALRRKNECHEVIGELVRAPGLAIARAFADVALYTHDWDGAEELARNILPAARSLEFEALGQIMLAHLATARGRHEQAADLLRLAGRHQSAWALEVRALFAALPFGPATDADRRAIAEELRAWNPDAIPASVAIPLAFHDGLHGHLRGFLLGLLAARDHDPEAVGLEADALAELPVPTGAEALVEHLTRTLDAERFRLNGQPTEALAVLERGRTDVWFQLAVGSPFYARTYERFLRAELLADVGRVDEALGWWQTIAQRTPYELVFLAEAERRQAEVLIRRGRLEAARAHQARAAAMAQQES